MLSFFTINLNILNLFINLSLFILVNFNLYCINIFINLKRQKKLFLVKKCDTPLRNL